jgi:hypothetical protein
LSAFTNAATVTSIAAAINTKTASTGVTATVVITALGGTDSGIKLTSTSGNLNISSSLSKLASYGISTGVKDENNSDSDSSDSDDDSDDDSDESTDDEATPAEPLKKVKPTIKFNPSGKKPVVEDSDSE